MSAAVAVLLSSMVQLVPASARVAPSVAVDTWYLPTSDGATRLFVEEIGSVDAPPIVVLHAGWGAEHSYLVPLLRPFAGRRHRFVLYDQRGSLLSPVADYSKVSLATQIADLELLRTTLGVERMTIFAHSMGTFLAMAYAEAHPDRVAGLILTGAIPARSPQGGGDAFWVAGKAYVAKLVARPETQRELAMATPASGRLTPRDETHIWRIRLAATNIYHVERWRGIPGGRAFYN